LGRRGVVLRPMEAFRHVVISVTEVPRAPGAASDSV
jgi:hypothetical protein